MNGIECDPDAIYSRHDRGGWNAWLVWRYGWMGGYITLFNRSKVIGDVQQLLLMEILAIR